MADATDGVLDVTVPVGTSLSKEEPVLADLPQEVAQLMMTESAGNLQHDNRTGRAVANAAMGSLVAGIAKAHNELDITESRANSALLATDAGYPSNAGRTA